MDLDELDYALVTLAVEEPDVAMRESARVLGVARGTVQARTRHLERAGILAGRRVEIGLAALGFTVDAFIHLHLAQGRLEAVTADVAAIPEVLQAWSTTGEGDILCRIVATSNLHLEEVVQALLTLPGVVRTRTEIALNERVPFRVAPLVARARERVPGQRHRADRSTPLA